MQHTLNARLVRLHTTKSSGKRKLTPTLAYFDIVPGCAIRSKSQRKCLVTFSDVGKALTIHASTHSACAEMRFFCTNNRIMILHVRIDYSM